MEFRLAEKRDLDELKRVYSSLTKRMKKDGLDIWDEIYPCEFFAEDIAKKQLFVALENNSIAGAFALCKTNCGQAQMKWQKEDARAFYIDRLGVNERFAKQGVATALLNFAAKTAKENRAEYLRLFVVNINFPAISLYKKNGFIKADGVYTEIIDKDLSFEEYGYEKRL